MITVDAETVSIEIKETLSFECHVQSKFDDIRNSIEYAFNENEIADNDILDDIKSFLDHKLTKDDKLLILNNIADGYEHEQYGNREGYEVSIFDADFAEKAIIDWIEDNFNFRADEI